MSGLSTRHVVLGLLVERPGYGYDLQQRIDARLGFLRLSESAVYKILERLEREAWIEEAGQRRIGITRRGAPRVMYRATALGLDQFRAWMATPCERALLRDELQAKLTVADPEDLPGPAGDRGGAGAGVPCRAGGCCAGPCSRTPSSPTCPGMTPRR